VLSLEKTSVSLSDVLLAQRRLAGKALETPLRESRWLSDLAGVEVLLKHENLQVGGSFKFRGALNALTWAKENGIHKIWTASAGNHGLGVAEACRFTDSEVTVCLPATASPLKRERLRAYNVGVIQHGEDCEVAENYARRLAKEKKAFYVSPYNNAEVIAGQGTIALEMLAARPDLTTLVVAVGGGGLVSGVGLVAKAINPNIRVVGAVAANSPVMMECVKAGRITPVFTDSTVADGIAGRIDPDTITFPIAREVVDEWVAIDEQDILSTIFEFLDNEGMVIEGAAAVAVAAVSRKMIGIVPGDKVGVLICGGNIAREIWHDLCFAQFQKSRGL
jgi:threonine dehydratase